MSDKVYTEVFFPALNKNYNFVLPVGITLDTAVKLMTEIIREKEFIQLEDLGLLLYDWESREMLDRTKTVFGSGIIDGKKLMLV
ncbi:MAG: hypothetical protein LBQ68_01555 [Clostridiales bacterium]|jgi:hypothetical protein|nr:hypothetical protein [Clostridiales bacterium]